MHGRVVVGPEGTDAGHMAFIVPRDVVRDEVHDHLQPVVMRPLHQIPELFHPALGDIRQIRVDVIVIRDGIRRSGLPFHELGMGRGAAFIGLPGGMPDQARVPDTINAKSPEILQGLGIDR